MAIVLDNGVSLPDIPADVLAAYPYAVIFNATQGSETRCALMAWTEPFVFLPTDASPIGMNIIFSGTNISTTANIVYELVDAEWQFLEETDAGSGGCPIGDLGSGVCSLLWSNHDILTITAFNTDTGEVTVGTEVYFPSSVVSYESTYAVSSDFLIGVADQVRRLTESTGKLTTDAMLTALEEVKLQEKTVDPTDAVQEVVPDGGYYGLSKVTVNAAEGTVLPDNARVYYVGIAETTITASAITSTVSVVPQ